MATWATLKPDDELRDIFSDGNVPIVSLVPFVPREQGCPLCYKVLSSALQPEQINELAKRLFQMWQPECASIEQAIEYITNGGLPLRCDRFSSVTTTDYFQLPHGVALSALLQGTYEEDEF